MTWLSESWHVRRKEWCLIGSAAVCLHSHRSFADLWAGSLANHWMWCGSKPGSFQWDLLPWTSSLDAPGPVSVGGYIRTWPAGLVCQLSGLTVHMCLHIRIFMLRQVSVIWDRIRSLKVRSAFSQRQRQEPSEKVQSSAGAGEAGSEGIGEIKVGALVECQRWLHVSHS